MARWSSRTVCRILQASPHAPQPATELVSTDGGTPMGHACLEALRPPSISRTPARGLDLIRTHKGMRAEAKKKKGQNF